MVLHDLFYLVYLGGAKLSGHILCRLCKLKNKLAQKESKCSPIFLKIVMDK